jgi:hypothetical protein
LTKIKTKTKNRGPYSFTLDFEQAFASPHPQQAPLRPHIVLCKRRTSHTAAAATNTSTIMF